MRYNNETHEIEIDAREFVAIARRGISAALPNDSDEPLYELTAKTSLFYTFESAGYNFALTARLYGADEGSVSLLVPTDSSPKRPRKEWRK